ncbi:DUF4337 domain-containing protein [Inhella gelatinilytica]|uniref:DUF4337 domain-containing protein n=1 Tax=Inhella gelatinilytica TaxID=2795030 RepID=A0A931NAZ1_9BURK|nr:DUF4337 domain-containing protein [Inhella gelatinilytica]MBH9553008.1 DUF4337 domain-containing protein [Inhella gelatinilytica]
MSGHGFHVHGPHDHELEHAAHAKGHGADGLKGQLAVITAVLATIGALFSYQGGATQANAALFKNDAAIKKTEASNQWAYYQSKSSKQNLAELGVSLLPEGERRDAYRKEIERYKAEKDDIKAKAESLEKESVAFDRQSAEQMHQHHRWAQATTALQVAIALAAIALLTERKWLEWGTLALGGVGVVLGGLAWGHV